MDLYQTLWIDRNASSEEIKKAYRKLAMKYHPDRNKWDKESEKKFKEINEAYQVLSDNSKRQQYDRFGSVSWTWWSWWFWGFSDGVDIDLWDIFDQFFWWSGSGFSWRRKKEKRGEDIEQVLEIDLKTSIYWWKKKIKIGKKSVCDKCEGIWWEWKKTCGTCNWRWQITYTSQSIFGTIQQTWTCNVCSGSGEVFDKICDKCSWSKRVFDEKEIDLDIPAWINDKMIIKLEAEGNDWVWTKASWDLYIKILVNLEEKWLKRKDIDLFYSLELDIVEAILWTTKELNIPIIWKRSIDITSWTQTNTTLKISWDWVKEIRWERKWDLYLDLNIKIPKKLSKKEKDLYLEIAKERKINVNNQKWIFEKIFG